MRPKVSIIIPVYNVENYIENMLESVRRQSFKEYEALIINDGSTDNSQKIIDEFCQKDPRFLSTIKENGGVASARNLGIEKAKGDYVVFYDPDDIIPTDAIKKMYQTAVSKNADMIIGVMEEISLGEHTIYMHSQKLAKQNKISPLDQHFFGAWSLCHKMFSLEFVNENGLKIEKLKNAEDGVFTFCALCCTNEIYGCDTVAYNYYKRPFWLTASATQTISAAYMEGLLSSHNRILKEAKNLVKQQSDLVKIDPDVYLQNLYVRFITGELINGYYRNIWRASEDILPRIIERTEEYRKHITESQWQEIIRKNRDLNLEKGFMTIEELAENPIITVILDVKVPARKLNLMIGSLYNQSFLRFQIIIPKDRKDDLDEAYRDKMNLQFAEGRGAEFKQKALATSKGEYVIFAEEFVLYTKNTLRQLEQTLHSDKSLDFAAVLVKHFDGESYSQLKIMEAAFGFTPISSKRLDIFSSGDVFMSNKLIRKSALNGMEPGNNPAKASLKLYGSFKFKKIRKGVMITDMTDEDIYEKAVKKPSGLAGLNAWKNKQIGQAINKAKRYITREDVDKIKKML